MPLSAYYGGHGKQVAEKMKARYGSGWQRVFFATQNAQKKRRRRRPRAG